MIEYITRLICKKCGYTVEFDGTRTSIRKYLTGSKSEFVDLPNDLHLCNTCANDYFKAKQQAKKIMDKYWGEDK
jgi:hypothetical protein